MTTRFSRLLALVILVSVKVAHAEPTPADIESARALYVQGLELRDRGDLGTSTERFQAAYALAATPITAVELGRAFTLQQRLLEARDVLLSVERLPLRADESVKAANARVEARALAEQLRTKIPSLIMHIVDKDGSAARVRVSVDGVIVPPEAITSPRKLNPGKHAIVAEREGARATAEVTLAPAETQTVTLTLTPGDPSPNPTSPTSGSGDSATLLSSPGSGDDHEPPDPWFYAGASVAGVGLVTGTITGVIALGKASDLSEICTGTSCLRSADDDVSSAQTMATVSTIAFVAAGVGAGVALISWLSRDTKPKKRLSTLRWTFP